MLYSTPEKVSNNYRRQFRLLDLVSPPRKGEILIHYMSWCSKRAIALAIVMACAGALLPVSVHADDDDDDDDNDDGFCSETAELAFNACRAEVQDDFLIATAICTNISDPDARTECKSEARAEKQDTKELCEDQLDAREEVCDLIGEERFDPDFDPANFVDLDDIGNSVAPNPFLSLVPGTQWKYESEGESITVTVTDKIKLVDGVSCRVVTDVVTSSDGFVVEDTDDWFAQDLEGNVWYCGEEVKDFEVFEGDEPVEEELVAIDGSFKAGRDGAKPGILLPANPQVGDGYRQEFDLGNAEDTVEVISVSGTESAPGGSCNGDCFVTRDFSALDPGPEENKYYAPGIGLIVEINLEDGARNELVEYVTP
jgi:hypothetical protein